MKTTENLKQLFELGLSIEDFTLELYMLWCESVTGTSREFQQVLANRIVANWFVFELSKNQTEYNFLIKNYKSASIEDKTELYIKCIFGLFSKFPKSLLEDAKKRDEKPQTTKVAGIKIEYSIVNQN